MAELSLEELGTRLQEVKDAIYYLTEKIEAAKPAPVQIDFDPLLGALGEVRDALGILARQTRENGEAVRTLAGSIGKIPSPEQLDGIGTHIDQVHADYVKALGEVSARTQALADSVSQISRAAGDLSPALARLNSKLEGMPSAGDFQKIGTALSATERLFEDGIAKLDAKLRESAEGIRKLSEAGVGTRDIAAKIESLASFEQQALTSIAEGINQLAASQAKANGQIIDALISVDKAVGGFDNSLRGLDTITQAASTKEQVEQLSKRVDSVVDQMLAFNALLDYVKEYTRRGYAPDAVRKALVDGGWAAPDVERAIALVQPPKTA